MEKLVMMVIQDHKVQVISDHKVFEVQLDHGAQEVQPYLEREVQQVQQVHREQEVHREPRKILD
jgi:hypothetical protein